MQARLVACLIVVSFASGLRDGLAQAIPCINAISASEDTKFSSGQVRAYDTRPGESASTLTILKVDRLDKLGIVVHVRVDGIQAHNPRNELVRSVQHMPFTRDAMLLSTTKLIRKITNLPTLQGYDYWRIHCGGVYTISVRDAVEIMEKTLNAP